MLFSSYVAALAAVSFAQAGSLSVSNKQHTNNAATSLAGNLMSHYSTTNGVLPGPYFWWESGGMWASIMQYWKNTGDAQYNSKVSAALAAQAGSGNNFMGPNTLGNDDQLWWAITSIQAAESGFPAGSGPSYLQLAETVFDDVAARWDTSMCSGGLGWQISSSAPGYHYKNAISNGLFFQLAARLASQTGDRKYSDWATKIFKWTQSVGIIEKGSYKVYDGTDATKGCVDLDHDQWSYNVGAFLYGVAVMLDHTGDSATWQPHLDGFVGAAQAGFFENGIMQEQMCEPAGNCNVDQLSFKAYLARWLAQTMVLVPSTENSIKPLLQSSAEGALGSCNGGPDGNTCGTRWTSNNYDGTQGAGQQIAALEIVQGLLANVKTLPAKRHVAYNFKA